MLSHHVLEHIPGTKEKKNDTSIKTQKYYYFSENSLQYIYFLYKNLTNPHYELSFTHSWLNLSPVTKNYYYIIKVKSIAFIYPFLFYSKICSNLTLYVILMYDPTLEG